VVILDSPVDGGGAAAAAVSGCRSQHHVVCLDRADGGHRVPVARGATVTVELAGSGLRWSDLREVGPALLHRTGSVVSRSGGLVASYRATSSGRTELEASGAPRCAPRRACPQFLLLWEVQVVIG
jgi:hypothetical protein